VVRFYFFKFMGIVPSPGILGKAGKSWVLGVFVLGHDCVKGLK
jgi:hypothetical protein